MSYTRGFTVEMRWDVWDSHVRRWRDDGGALWAAHVLLRVLGARGDATDTAVVWFEDQADAVLASIEASRF